MIELDYERNPQPVVCVDKRGFGGVPVYLIPHQWLLGASIPPATSRDCQFYYERRLHIASCSIMTRVQSIAKILQYAS